MHNLHKQLQLLFCFLWLKVRKVLLRMLKGTQKAGPSLAKNWSSRTNRASFASASHASMGGYAAVLASAAHLACHANYCSEAHISVIRAQGVRTTHTFVLSFRHL